MSDEFAESIPPSPPPFPPPPAQPTQMPAAGRTRRLGGMPRALMVGGLTFGLAVGGAGIAFAATSGSSTPSTTVPTKPVVPGPGHRGFWGPGPGPRARFGLGGPAGAGRVLHGEFTTRKAGGGYQLVKIQVGQVTGVKTTSITVRSADGYTHSYAVTSSTVVDAERDGISSVKTGDQVQVLATTVNGTDTAFNIVDTTRVGAGRKSFGFGARPARPSIPGSPATPATPTTPTTAATKAAI